jgi:hypothetical protein
MDLQARNREWVHTSWIAQESKLRVKNPDAKLAYDNQKEAAQNIFECFRNGIVAVTLLALPQVGKTGVMAYVAYLMTTTIDDEIIIRPENVYIISGMNEVEWRDQTKKSFPDALNVHVYTRSDFSKITTLDSLENALIIIDECHIAAEEKQQLSSTLEGCGLNTPEALDDRNVRILQVSATPAHTLFNAERIWGDDHAIVRLQSSPKYIGFKQFLEAGRIVDTASTTPKERIERMQTDINKFDSPKYHVIRPSRGDNTLLTTMITENGWILKTHTSKTREDTDYLFGTKPSQHTIIMIKGFWRAGKRLDDKYIGVMYEGPSLIPDVNVIAQSLAGRACGNDKQVPSEQSPLIYCDKKSLQDYIKWYEGDGSFDKISYQSRHLKVDEEGNVSVRSTFHGGKFTKKNSEYTIHSETFDTRESAKLWTIEKLTYSSTFYNTFEKDGELHIHYRGEPRKLLSEEEARASTLINIGANSAARIMPVIRDLGWGVASSARIMPVKTPDIKYIVIYKKDKLRV